MLGKFLFKMIILIVSCRFRLMFLSLEWFTVSNDLIYSPGRRPAPNLKKGHRAKAFKAKGLNERSFCDIRPQGKPQCFPLRAFFPSLSLSLYFRANKRDIGDRGCCHLKAVTLPMLLIINLTSFRIEWKKHLCGCSVSATHTLKNCLHNNRTCDCSQATGRQSPW